MYAYCEMAVLSFEKIIIWFLNILNTDFCLILHLLILNQPLGHCPDIS